MKPVITILLIALWCSVSAQQDTFYHWPLAYGRTILPGEHIELVSGDNVTIVDQDGDIVIEPSPFESTPGDRAFYLPVKNDGLIVDILTLYDEYYNQAPEADMFVFPYHPIFGTCDTIKTPVRIKETSFEGFIKWLRQQ